MKPTLEPQALAAPPILWSIAGHDSGGGAGLSADQRAAEALEVHLCPVLAVVTAQHSRAVTQVAPIDDALLEAQLAALADDMPPRVVKTGLLGSASQLRVVARWVDTLRRQGPVALVVDPVLGASSGRVFADASMLAAYRDELLPRTTLITPNRPEAALLAGLDPRALSLEDMPALARALCSRGAGAVALTGGDAPDHQGRVLDWIDTPQASGWLASPREATPHRHGTGCTFASAAAAALARGFPQADALVLAKMATLQALRRGWPAGAGPGPVRAASSFGSEPSLLPQLSWGQQPRFVEATSTAAAAPADEGRQPRLGLYAIVDRVDRLQQVLAAGVRTVQLRIKAAHADAALAAQVREAVDACRAAGAMLFVNDHVELARELGAPGVHLGQEDLLALGEAGRAVLGASGLALGISSHSLWELARAKALAPRYVACGPVWPTLTKRMPWHPQGLDNLAWWCHMAGLPVVAIGGMLEPWQFEAAARCGADGLCAVRVLDQAPDGAGTAEDALRLQVDALQRAMARGRALTPQLPPALPHPSLTG